MNNSEKLSLFRKGTSSLTGLTDRQKGYDFKQSRKLSLNKEIISNLNNFPISEVDYCLPTRGNCTDGCTKTDICCIITKDPKCDLDTWADNEKTCFFSVKVRCKGW